MPDLDINFQFLTNAQSLKGAPREIQAMGDNFARMITEEVALAASQNSFNRARRNFIVGVRAAIQAEVSRMAMLIGRFLPLPDKYTGPNGDMSLSDGLSATARLFGFKSTLNRKQAGIEWQKRSPKYLAWKRKNHLPNKWWAAHGELQKDLMSKGEKFYEDVFGPIRVRLERPPAVRGAKGRFARSNSISTLARNPGDIEGGARKTVNVTRPGGRGKISAEFTVGTLHVDVFGKITPQMLPGLASPIWAPTKADPTPGEGVVGLFPNDGPGGTRNKLLGTRAGRHYRYAVEPFVSFYLMRAIPNAVWHRTENLVRGA